jgi:hypothetical protein
LQKGTIELTTGPLFPTCWYNFFSFNPTLAWEKRTVGFFSVGDAREWDHHNNEMGSELLKKSWIVWLRLSFLF